TGRRWAEVLGAVFVVALFFAVVVSRERPPERAAELPHRVAVLPFAVQGTGSYDYLGSAMAELLSAKLSIDDLMLTFAPPDVAPGEMRDRDLLEKAAMRVGATEYVTGRVIQTGSTAQITATLASVSGDRVSQSLVTVEDEDSLFAAVDLMARELLLGWAEPSGAPRRGLGGLPTTSLPALKAFLAGERALEEGLHDEAIGHLQDALRADSSFALAELRLYEAALWADEPELLLASTQRAWELRERLPWNLQLLAEARHAMYQEQDARRSVELMRQLVTADPGNAEAAYELADLRFHQATQGHSVSGTRALLEQVLERDPDHLGALLHLARLYAREGQIEALEPLVARGLHLARDSRSVIKLRGLLAFASGDAAAQDRILAEMRTLDDDTLLGVASVIISFVEEPADLVPLARTLTEEERSLRIRELGVAWLAALEAASGRADAAQEILTTYDALDPRFLRAVALRLEHTSLAPSARRLALARDRMAELVDQPRDSLFLTVQLGTSGDAAHVTSLLALADLRLGDTFAFAERLNRVETLESEYPADVRFAAVLEAAAALEADIPSEALRRLDSAEAWEIWSPGDLYVLLRAAALADLGRKEDALRWYAGLPGDYQFGFATAPLRRLRRAELLDALGRTGEASAQYARFLHLFSEPDPELRPLVQKVKDRLQELEAPDRT
ncbi:MAG: hypothetical protein Q8W45_04660, partial [Candidatus Palauibacterales bacterium]|nr:hypothetical protein [Candidatus Palauibacterales bacterium]